MKKIKEFFKSDANILAIAGIVIMLVILVITVNIFDKKEPVVIYKQSPELLKIKDELKNQVFESESKILVLETKIESLEKLKVQNSQDLTNSTIDLEKEVVEVVKIVQDSALIVLLDDVKIEQQNLVNTYENIIELKDSVILEQNEMIRSYVIATDKLSNEIEILHAKNNELIINNSRNKSKIKKRNRIIAIGGTVIIAGITGAILLRQ